jgi:hypothetical protein
MLCLELILSVFSILPTVRGTRHSPCAGDMITQVSDFNSSLAVSARMTIGNNETDHAAKVGALWFRHKIAPDSDV